MSAAVMDAFLHRLETLEKYHARVSALEQRVSELSDENAALRRCLAGAAVVSDEMIAAELHRLDFARLLRRHPVWTAPVTDVVSTEVFHYIGASTGKPWVFGSACRQFREHFMDSSSTDHLRVMYAIGGISTRDEVVARVDRYDATARFWEAVASLPTPRQGFAAVAFGGRLHALGGAGRDGEPLPLVERYSPESASWEVAAPLPTARVGLAAVAVGGKIYAIGGVDRNGETVGDVARYDPVTNGWVQVASLPTPRSDLAAVVLDGKIFTLGGYGGGRYLSTVERYDPDHDRWEQVSPMPTGRSGLAAAVVG